MIELARKLEILKAMVDEDYKFPRNQIYRDSGKLIATNGSQLLAFDLSTEESSSTLLDLTLTLDEGEAEFRKRTLKNIQSDTPALIRQWLAREAPARDVDLMALLAFLGVGEYLRCPYCSGSGSRPVAEPNLEDEGLNDSFNCERIVDFDGAPMDGNLLIGLLAHLPSSETVALSTWPEKGGNGVDGHMLRLTGDRWTLIQMGIDKKQHKGKVEVYGG